MCIITFFLIKTKSSSDVKKAEKETSNSMFFTRKMMLKWLAILCPCGLVVLICIQLYLNFELPRPTNNHKTTDLSDGFLSRKMLCTDVDELSNQVSELSKQLEEMERIKLAGMGELTRMEEKVFKLNEEIVRLARNRDIVRENWIGLQKQVTKSKAELKKIKYSALAGQRQKIIPVGLPIQYEGKKSISAKYDKPDTMGCSLEDCFDYSKCPFTKEFSFYLYNPIFYSRRIFSTSISQYLFEKALQLPYYKQTFNNACVAVAILDVTPVLRQPRKSYLLEEVIGYLKYWNKNGQNHILLFIHEDDIQVDCSVLEKIDTGMAVVVFDTFCKTIYRNRFDLIIPHLPTNMIDKQHLKWKLLQSLLPLKRQYLFNLIVDMDLNSSLTRKVRRQDLESLGKTGKAFVQTHCVAKNLAQKKAVVDCKDSRALSQLFKISAFTVLIMDVNDEILYLFYAHLFESLRCGSVPVLVGNRNPLPISDLIAWEEFAIVVSLSRLPELPYILETISDEDLFELKKQGRFIWETYFSSSTTVMETVFSAIRSRIKVPPLPFKDFVAVKIKDIYKKEKPNPTEAQIVFELPSKMFVHNWTYLGSNLHSSWNTPPGAHRMTPSPLSQNPLPANLQFTAPSEYAPIADGDGGDGVPFSKALGGDFPVEHFTVVLLTYDREVILIESLERLLGLKYLNSVIVVWNNPIMPSPELKWPDIGVKVHIIKPGTNSLNNRFLPYDLIDTDAVLSMDDDIYLRHDEIDLAFRVWRGNRDRIVGFPGRFHSWQNNTWYYNANYSCELSMVLTGGAFIHKFYLYMYTYVISPSIRDIVDEFTNCEDIAMNFLVAHITRKQPIKVTSRWTFRCGSCPSSLSLDQSHFTERGKCIHLFEEIFGYIPLRRTQFRTDSVLFKTRLPPKKTKCYQFV